jgi:hypothetical protein
LWVAYIRNLQIFTSKAGFWLFCIPSGGQFFTDAGRGLHSKVIFFTSGTFFCCRERNMGVDVGVDEGVGLWAEVGVGVGVDVGVDMGVAS